MTDLETLSRKIEWAMDILDAVQREHQAATGQRYVKPLYLAKQTGGCTICDTAPAVKICGEYWLCGKCAAERMEFK